jgi:predicted nucleotidyltransferase
LIPFGGIETAERTIAWPPEEDIVMRVTGFSDGLESAVPVRLDQNLIIRVVSLPVLLVLKLFAWRDRKHEMRDAPDIYTLLRQYGDADNEDRLFGEDMNVLEAEGYDFELAGARLIAHDAARVVSADTQKRLREILESNALMEELTNQIIVSSPRNDPEHVRRCEMLIRNLREGFLPAAQTVQGSLRSASASGARALDPTTECFASTGVNSLRTGFPNSAFGPPNSRLHNVCHLAQTALSPGG